MKEDQLKAAKQISTDLLWGAEEIGGYLGLTAKQVYNRRKQLPLFKMRGTLVASRARLQEFFSDMMGGDAG